MICIENVSKTDQAGSSSRRGFLKGMLGAGAFVLSARLVPVSLFAATSGVAMLDAMGEAALHPSVYLAIDTKGTSYIIAHRSEMGSGSRTA